MTARSQEAVKELQIRRARIPQHVPSSSPPLSPATDSVYSVDEYSPSTSYPSQAAPWSTHSGYPISLTGLDRSTIAGRDDETLTLSTHHPFEVPEKVSPISPDDDFVSFISSPTPTPMDQDAANRRDANANLEPVDLTGDEDEPRISVGPKMRFVSRAPWETGADELAESESDDDFVGPSDALSIINGKFSGWKHREEQQQPTIRSLALASLRSASPKDTSPPANKNSFSSGRKTQELNREDVSNSYMRGDAASGKTSNSFNISPRSSYSVNDQVSLHAPQPHHTNTRNQLREQPPPLPDNYPSSYARPFRGQGTSYQRDRDRSPFRSTSPPPSNSFIHPYANPDAVCSMEALPIAPATSRIPKERLSDDKGSSNASTRRSSESTSSSSRAQAAARKGLVPDRGMPLKPKMAIHEEEHERSSKILPTAALRGAPFSNYNPMSNLISLDQARVRVQQNSKAQYSPTSSNFATPPKMTPAIPASFASPPVSTPEQKNGSATRRRALSAGKRSTSSGEGDGPAPKSLKHKRSGFMKLFSKDKDSSPKEVPSISISDPIMRPTSTPPRFSRADTETDIPPVPSLHNVKRVPPPSLSIVMSSPSVGQVNSDGQESTLLSQSLSKPSDLPSSQYLNSSTPSGRLTIDAPSSSRPNNLYGGRPPASAPPSQMSFEGLSLRPVSTIFSAKFTDILGSLTSPTAVDSPLSQQNLNVDPSPITPTLESSRTNSMSTFSDYPLTPGSGGLINTNSSTTLQRFSSSPSDNSSLVASLQEQLSNMRKIHQTQIWELEGQVRDLKEELEKLRDNGECETCGMAKKERRARSKSRVGVSVVDRPRPRAATRTGGERTVFGGVGDR